jgi:hypothetical protein
VNEPLYPERTWRPLSDKFNCLQKSFLMLPGSYLTYRQKR